MLKFLIYFSLDHLGSCVSNSGKIEVLPNLQSPTSEISSSSLTPPLQPGGAGSTSGYDSHCTSSDTSYEPGTRCFDYGDFPTQQFHYGGVNSSSVYHENQCSNHVNSPSRSEYRDQRMTNLGVGCNLPGVRCSNASSSESRSANLHVLCFVFSCVLSLKLSNSSLTSSHF